MKNIINKLMTFVAGLSFIFTLSSCENSSPVQINSTKVQEPTAEELTFLKSRNPFLGKIFKRRQLITVTDGGILKVGDHSTGISGIKFNPGDLSADLNVGFWWDSNRFEVEFSPHGSIFNNPVLIRLSYKDADLTGIDEDSLKIWYYDEEEGIWELIGQELNKELKYIKGTITHFSRYAIAAN